MLPDDRQAGLIAGGRPTINLNERSRKVRFDADRLEVASVGDRPVYDTNEGSAMATYVALIDWTDRGVQAFKDSVDRYESAQSQMRSMGVEFTNIYWTLGSHDIVSVVEAPDDQTLAAALLAVAGQGNIRTTTLRAFSADEMREVISKAG
ncbi:MAG: GYD domain-containing protein [Solirubrobacterales bacterium]|nr:GYD domain-containing protein [Solirubrobacterales bacterium]MBV9364437.1 GYD domain-containing protein [Solirubrobacterales bacterium]MBV9807708.1 GYD domain-containing protein [Solirubrobacterales bacterium]